MFLRSPSKSHVLQDNKKQHRYKQRQRTKAHLTASARNGRPSFLLLSGAGGVWSCPGKAGSLTSTHLRFGIQGDDFLIMVQKFAGMSNVNGRFLFVAGENPNLQTCLTQFSNGFGDSILQAVFNPRGTCSKVPV